VLGFIGEIGREGKKVSRLVHSASPITEQIAGGTLITLDAAILGVNTFPNYFSRIAEQR
jgi:hypothetical protein